MKLKLFKGLVINQRYKKIVDKIKLYDLDAFTKAVLEIIEQDSE